jgi:hypothetical protein
MGCGPSRRGECAECFKPEEKEIILKEIREKHGSSKVFNGKLYQKTLDWRSFSNDYGLD